VLTSFGEPLDFLSATLKLSTEEKLKFLTKLVRTKWRHAGPRAAAETVLQCETGWRPEYSERSTGAA
jgi:hypothetical protein